MGEWAKGPVPSFDLNELSGKTKELFPWEVRIQDNLPWFNKN